jgi:hypothetical protein
MNPRLLVLLALATLVSCRAAAPEYPLPVDAGEKRWRHYYDERAYPFGTIPADGRRRALIEATRRSPVQNESVETNAATNGRWRAIGPQPVQTMWPWQVASGRINTIAISPANSNLILAGSSSGGVWRSTNGGTTWVPVTDAHADLSIGVIAFAPSNPSIVYAAMGSDFLGTGVLRSNDAGLTWRNVSGSTFAQRGRSLRMAVDPANPERVWVAQIERQGTGSAEVVPGLLLSENGGITWRNVMSATLTDFLHVPGTAQTLLAAVGRSPNNVLKPGIYKSVDGGTTWTIIRAVGGLVPSAGYYLLGVAANNPNRYYAYGGGDVVLQRYSLIVSNDAGATWSVAAGKLPSEYPFWLGTDPTDANTLYVGFRDAYKSRDGGATWTNVTKSINDRYEFVPHLSTTHIDQHAFAAVPGTIYFGNDGGIFKTTDGATTFTSLSSTLSIIQAYAISAHPTNPKTLYLGTQDNGLERLGPDGSWFELLTGDYGTIAFDPVNPSRVISNYIEGNLYAVGNQGDFAPVATNSTWGEPTNKPRIAFIAPFEQSRRRGTLYFGTWRLHVSDDFGRTWRAPGAGSDLTLGSPDRLRAIGITEQDASTIYTGSQNGRVMVSRDGGFSWTISSTGLPVRTIKSFAIDPRNAATAYVALSGYGSAHVYVTRNFGAEWTPFSTGLPDVPVNALLLDPADPTVLLAGTDIGVFRRIGDEPWKLFNSGIPPVIVTDFETTADARIVLATYGRGAYELVRTDSSGGKRRSVAR